MRFLFLRQVLSRRFSWPLLPEKAICFLRAASSRVAAGGLVRCASAAGWRLSIAHAVRGKRGTMTTTDIAILIEALAALIAALAQLIVAMRQGP